ncbi:MAG: PAS domain-containing sensor histidine kinase, partial [Elusimicrobiota bacterium]
IMLGASLLPVLIFLACVAGFKLGYAYALFIAAAAALLTGFFAAETVMSGLARPMARVSLSAKSFIAADYRLESVIKKEGWPEAESLISGLNRLMLELSAYRAFHLNQVVEDRAKAQALIETITDGVLLVDDRGQLIYSNQKALNLLCIPRQEPIISLPGSVRQEAFAAALTGIMSSRESPLKAEVEVKSPDETYSIVKNFQVIARHFSLATLKRPGRVIVLRDVTVEKEMECARETLFSMITHDMRAPLSSIYGYALMMKKTVPPATQEERCLEAILRSSARLNGMIEDILNTIKLEHGDMKLAPVTVNAGDLCAQVFEVHEPLAARKNIKFSVIPPPEKIEFSGDIALLERVITNLVGNALKFTHAGGTVSLSCLGACGEVVFSVEDNGQGIPKEKHAEIFEKYAQLEEHKFMGFGLGLAMCKLVVELHKGRIWVESGEGRGSKFAFAVPAK